MSNAKVIIVGGGLSGLSAAHTVLERGGNVVCLPTIHLGEAKADI
jgi:succinate dehydrogenase/fumarate reductase flavoprotein subunit